MSSKKLFWLFLTITLLGNIAAADRTYLSFNNVNKINISNFVGIVTVNNRVHDDVFISIYGSESTQKMLNIEQDPQKNLNITTDPKLYGSMNNLKLEINLPDNIAISASMTQGLINLSEISQDLELELSNESIAKIKNLKETDLVNITTYSDAEVYINKCSDVNNVNLKMHNNSEVIINNGTIKNLDVDLKGYASLLFNGNIEEKFIYSAPECGSISIRGIDREVKITELARSTCSKVTVNGIEINGTTDT